MVERSKAAAINDAGEKIGGARKDWRNELMGLDDLDSMTAAELATLVRKDRVWPTPDYEELVSQGMDPVAAALVKIARDGMAAQPRPARGVDPVRSANNYVEIVSSARDAMMAAKTVDDVRSVEQVFQREINALRSDRAAHTAAYNRYFSIYKGRTSPLRLDQSDIRKAQAMVAAGFPGKVPAWKRGVELRQYEGEYMIFKAGSRLGGFFPSEAEAWNWLQEKARIDAEAKPQEADTVSTTEEPERPHLDSLVRNGDDVRQGRDVSSDDFITTFGFRAVEFGKWLPDGERQAVLNLAYDAFHDLALAIGAEPKAMSLDGTLAIAFGARGGGRFAAHYESGRAVINLTRIRGAGTLAHEWGHALDHFLGKRGGVNEIEAGDPRYATGGREHTKSRIDQIGRLPDPLPKLVDALVRSLRETPRTHEEEVSHIKSQISAAQSEVDKFERLMKHHMETVDVKRQDKKWLRQARDYVERKSAFARLRTQSLDKLQSGLASEPTSRRSSDYFQNAKALSGSGDYWTRPTELFARAFECAVSDILEAKGVQSDYLVHSVDENLYASPKYKGNPYPVGSERERYRLEIEELCQHANSLLLPPMQNQMALKF